MPLYEVTLEYKVTIDAPDLQAAKDALLMATVGGRISRVKVDGAWYAVWLPAAVKALVYPSVGAQAQTVLDAGDTVRDWSQDLPDSGLHVKVG